MPATASNATFIPPEDWTPPTRRRGVAQFFAVGFMLALGALVAMAVFNAVASLREVIIMVVVALFGALGLQPLIDRLQTRGVPRVWAALLVTVGLLLAVGLGLAAVLPLVVDQITLLVTNAPAVIERLRANPQVAQLDQQFHLLERFNSLISSPGTWTDAFGGVVGAGVKAASFVGQAVFTIVLLLFFTWSGPRIKEGIYQLSPASKRQAVRDIANQIFDQIGGYLVSMMIVMALWGVGTLVAANVVGLGRYAMALAVMTMLLVTIPAVGSWIALVVAGLVALSVSPGSAVGLLAYYIVYQQLDAYVIQPRLFASTLSVPPSLVILGVLAGMTLLGPIGAILAIPFVASMLLIYRQVVVPRLDAS